eukprot:CAMPEP_0119008638 /NCGR_PEP_ID=MMETSP1176-20130426/3834_1 /TAXON_ID=265551 /ORGANISM="Synedropsis recta cf, Strain CCMP1620" /LENGTH=417 /DNA_ID=CAMNT_0006961009 /DNA_START=41 /DNA_END=1294 /DNA_ORIENTATION=-
MDAQYAAYAAQRQNAYLMQAGMQGGMGLEYPLQGVDYPGMNDVMCGRGGGTNNHIGNIRFRQLVNEHKLRYLAASKVDKPKVAMEVVLMWRALDPPGRYLTKTDASQGDDSLWHDVGDKKAREKASQCLRERTPDVMPFVKQLQEQEKKKKEEDKKRKEEDKSQKSSKSGKSKDRSKSAAETVVSSATPDATLSMATPSASISASTMATPDVTNSSNSVPVEKKKKHKSRDEVAQTIPTAAALMENVFDDEDFDGDEDDLLSYATYQRQMQDFLDSAPKGENGDEYSITDRSILMETMSTNSKEWVKSFASLDGSNMMMSIGTSLRDVEEMPPPDSLSRSDMMSNRSQKMMKQTGNNSISMLSDLTDFSSIRNKSTRSGRMQNAKAPSNFSMMSELTDLSEGLKDMGLQQGNGNTGL